MAVLCANISELDASFDPGVDWKCRTALRSRPFSALGKFFISVLRALINSNSSGVPAEVSGEVFDSRRSRKSSIGELTVSEISANMIVALYLRIVYRPVVASLPETPDSTSIRREQQSHLPALSATLHVFSDKFEKAKKPTGGFSA